MTGNVGELVESDIRKPLSCEVDELNVRSDHIHIVISIPSKVSVSTYMGTIKGKTAIKLFRSYSVMKKKPHWGNYFWAREYFVNTVQVAFDKKIIDK